MASSAVALSKPFGKEFHRRQSIPPQSNEEGMRCRVMMRLPDRDCHGRHSHHRHRSPPSTTGAKKTRAFAGWYTRWVAEVRALAEVYGLAWCIATSQRMADEVRLLPARRPCRRGWPGTTPRRIPRASPSAPPARATNSARVVAAAFRRGAVRWTEMRPGGKTCNLAPHQPCKATCLAVQPLCRAGGGKGLRSAAADHFQRQQFDIHGAEFVVGQRQHPFLDRGLQLHAALRQRNQRVAEAASVGRRNTLQVAATG